MNPITSCHQAEAVAVGTNEGTNHYECPICHEPVNIDGSNPSSARAIKLDIERLEKRIAALEPVKKTENYEYNLYFHSSNKLPQDFYIEETLSLTPTTAHKLAEAISALVEYMQYDSETNYDKIKTLIYEARKSYWESQ